ncbi:unnamed protein product [Cylicocyclus nassatus]|uniref:Serpentine receptor class gamma n=1 Tax=Cylicocyclus nassatus TaxID=53992 RepID=A0AA36GP68_CYLNA|nr:unnamed protein product [Cylicocyclus nassatus]
MGHIIGIRTITACGRVLIALNRFTSVYSPLRQEQIWTTPKILILILSLWSLSALISTAAVVAYADSITFIWIKNNSILQIVVGEFGNYTSRQSLAVNAVTVTISIISYTYCHVKIKKLEQRQAHVEGRLLLCALASTIPSLGEVLRSMTTLLTEDQNIYVLIAEIWFYETEITMTLPLWVQLIVNENIRERMIRRVREGHYSNTALSNAKTCF